MTDRPETPSYPEVGDAIRAARRAQDQTGSVTIAILTFLLAVRDDGRWSDNEQEVAADIVGAITEWERAT